MRSSFLARASAACAPICARASEAAPDLARPLSRLALLRGGPRDLAALRDGLECRGGDRGASCWRRRLPRRSRCRTRKPPAPSIQRLQQGSREALADDLPLKRSDGNFIRAGFDAELDEMRALRDESRRVVADLQARYCALTEIRQLKLKHNNFLGFFVEVPQAQGEKLMRPPFDATFVHRQTMADAMRFSTVELAELEAKIASAADRALAREQAIFDQARGANSCGGDLRSRPRPRRLP